MATLSPAEALLFADLGPRKVVADFSGGTLSTDGGSPLLRQVDAVLALTRTLAGCFRDGRDRRFVDHSIPELLRQRIYGVALGYEDLIDHAQLRHDPLLATACGKRDPLGQARCNPHVRGSALLGTPRYWMFVTAGIISRPQGKTTIKLAVPPHERDWWRGLWEKLLPPNPNCNAVGTRPVFA